MISTVYERRTLTVLADETDGIETQRVATKLRARGLDLSATYDAENARLRRLEARGLVTREVRRPNGFPKMSARAHWRLTDAGREVLS